jgi:polyvinyl alcohol dehydrogenase (cytochrome)
MRKYVEIIPAGLRAGRAMGMAPGAALMGVGLALAGACSLPGLPGDPPGSPGNGPWSPLWLMSGHDLHNTRSQPHEVHISRANVSELDVRWIFAAEGDVSATPAVDGNAVYVPDWAGNLFKLDRHTGAVIWRRSISEYNGVPGSMSRTTPVIHGDALIFGDQAGRNVMPASVMAVSRRTGDLLWITQVDSHPMSVVTQSAVVFDDRVYVGVSSHEEYLAGQLPDYECCTFRGSMLSLDAATGDILWQAYLAPAGYSGSAVWGSTPVIDAPRGSVYIGTGNNYTVPDAVADCVREHLGDPDATQACLAPDNHFDSVMALDLYTGAVKWVTRSIPFDAWTVGCVFPDAPNCPEPSGPDYDFGQGPALFTVRLSNGVWRQLLGAGQKSGQYWTYDPDDGRVVWVTQVGPGGVLGGLQWGSATDGQRIYTAISNYDRDTWRLIANGQPTGRTANAGIYSALDASTGTILWQTADPHSAPAQGPVTVANGVVYACSMDPLGHMYALNAVSGAIRWSFISGGSCGGGASIVDGSVYWGSGYSALAPLGATGNNELYSFGLPQGPATTAPRAGEPR